jgi:hypothetical protein
MKTEIKRAWNWFDWELFKVITGFTEEELHTMPEKIFAFERRIYDIFMLFFMFACFSFGGAIIYEGINYKALGYVPLNFIQFSPIVMLFLLTGLMYFASILRDRAYERFAGESYKQDQGECTRWCNVVSGLPATDVLVFSPWKI